MSAVIMDGRAVAATVGEEVRQRVAGLRQEGGAPPGLDVVLCGDDPASVTYVGGKSRMSERLGIRSEVHHRPADTSTEELLDLVRRLNADHAVDAILVQLPLPAHVDSARVLEAVAPEKDVDAFHPVNLGRLAAGRPGIVPCTPAGCMELLRRHQIPVRGARAVVVGRSVIVGRPMAILLLNADATVTVCHSRTPDLAAVCREADVLVVAAGRPGLIDAGAVRPGACVVDVGMNRVEGRLRGDVDRASVEAVAGWLTPVPGGVGPMTVAMLMRNTVDLAEAHRAARRCA
jgi:methylenetetrahydrofolate dehydrogenase (NADP+)/methenyltetrahydrofolate cyclohydrolase